MRRFLQRHAGVVLVVTAVAGGLFFAIYVHAVESSHPKGKGLFAGITALRYGNLTLLVAVGFLALFEITRRVDSRVGPQDVTGAIEHIIESMVRGYVFPDGWDTNAYRGYCHQIDKKCRILKPVAVASPFPGGAERAPLPVCGQEAAGLVIAQAFNEKREVCEEVSNPPQALGIWEKVKTVIAVPIFDVDDSNTVLGTISIDTSLPKDQTVFENPHTAAVLYNVARAVALLWRS